ncbi:catalase family protein [Paracoccus sp. MBLB3053]|uniref:Catalase family protein n=1 Tax=Paracoccus aurantius TaxID=3073814 RepID=A0ABU2HXK8_9RHOB|nr:catalase family protein [Paracoccus sp. MBLB3053]MDS9469792.1 catalase family protein [Paracoccus sp. MBLB3053]
MFEFLIPLRRLAHRGLEVGLHIERRFEPFFRPQLDRLTREPLAKLVQHLKNRNRPDLGLGLAEEKLFDWEEQALQDIIDEMREQMNLHFQPGAYERGGNTKTHGLVRATFTVRPGLAENLRRGVFAVERSYPAYIRFAGPGPDVPEDIRDVGFGSMTVKLMDVPGEKLMDEEKFTQDWPAVVTPTFVTPNVRENAKLQYWSTIDEPLWYFLNPKDLHFLDFLMQGLWNQTQYNPLGQRYYSCVPYLLGEGQAMLYSYLPLSKVGMDIPGVPFGRVPPNYLRDNMARTLRETDVDFDMLVQIQTDPHRMPIEDASIRWPEDLSPWVPVARIHIPRQDFDNPEMMSLNRNLKFNPWHSLREHRPLGNQSRARRRLYQELSNFRQIMNRVDHVEPTGTEFGSGKVAVDQSQMPEVRQRHEPGSPDAVDP